MMTRPLISVVIPHYQDLANLRLCLDLLDQQTLPRTQWEVIVSDNKSPAGLEAVEAVVAGRARVVLATEKGAGPARNAGATKARGASLAFLDSDCRPEPDWLAESVSALREHAVVGGNVSVCVDNPDALSGAEAFEMVFAFDNARYISEEGFSVSANLLVRRDVWERVGGFRAAVSEDVDWCQRASNAGFPVSYAARVRVAHPARTNVAELQRKWKRLVQEGYLLTREKPGGELRWLIRSWLVAFSPFLHMFKVLRSSRLAKLQDRWKAIGVLFFIRWFRVLEAHRILLWRK